MMTIFRIVGNSIVNIYILFKSLLIKLRTWKKLNSKCIQRIFIKMKITN